MASYREGSGRRERSFSRRGGLEDSYITTPVVPYQTTVCGIPFTTFTSTLVSGCLYLLCAILLLSLNCPFDRDVTYYFITLCVALVAICTMAGVNMVYPRYKFNCLSLSISLCYSGSAALVLSSLVLAAGFGLCPERAPTNNRKLEFFKSKNVANYIVWFSTALGLCFQVVAHYFYG